MLFLLRSRLKTVVLTLVVGLAAPRIARVLRGYGERHPGGGAMRHQVPLGAATALEKVAGWVRPPKQRRGRR